jgi:hypothetical protein
MLQVRILLGVPKSTHGRKVMHLSCKEDDEIAIFSVCSMKTFRIKSKIVDDVEWFYAEQFINDEWIIPVNTENRLSYEKFEKVWWKYVKHPPKTLGFKSRDFLEVLIEQEINHPMCGIYWHDWYGDRTKVLD